MTKEKVLEFIRHYQGTVAAIVVCIALVVWGLGCQVTTQNPFNPAEKVTQSELEAEVQLYVTKVQNAYDDIERQEAIRSALLEAGLAYAQGGGVNPIGLATTLMGIVGVGAVIDNRKKDSVIKSKSGALAALAGTKPADAEA